jgi:hypothetical protein
MYACSVARGGYKAQSEFRAPGINVRVSGLDFRVYGSGLGFMF